LLRMVVQNGKSIKFVATLRIYDTLIFERNTVIIRVVPLLRREVIRALLYLKL